ncbi:alpha/beta fold hydrolase [Parafrankia sp. BMG5.11]|uniref:alpha/beta fold hydrolase n=1 Tax=Parafrankia sp. BMG5.11 TaxID=222540 RepID=UPI0035A02F53
MSRCTFYASPVPEPRPRRCCCCTDGRPRSQRSAVISRLAHPETAGGDPEDGLTVVVPSLPGYGFSPPASAPIGVRSAGHLFHRLLTEVLGEARYYVHGGDQGAPIAEWMAFDHPDHCSGLHTTLLGVRHEGAPLGSGLTGVEDPTADEILFVQREHNLNTGPLGAYFLLQATAPLTLAPALADSPAGFAAWVLEKFHLWSDQNGTSDGPALTLDDIITEIMIYLVSDSVASSLVAYAEFLSDPITLPPAASSRWPPRSRPSPTRGSRLRRPASSHVHAT